MGGTRWVTASMSPVRPVLPARLDLNSVEVWGSLSTPTLPAPETDEWDVASLDLDAYLDRVGHPRVQPSADALKFAA